MNKKKKVIIIILAVVLLVAAGVGGYFAYNKYFKEEETTTTTEAESTTEPETVPLSYEDYYNQNNDFVGWIKIDGTNVDYPVVHRNNNDYYLNHNFEKKYEGRGAIFMDMACNPETLDKNTVIHGHNWLDNTMFSKIPQYSKFDYYKAHPVIEFNTRTEMHKWKIISVFITTASPEEDNGYIFNYIYPHVGGSNYQGWADEITKRSLYNTGVDFNANDKFLTLSTCTREVDSGKNRADARIAIVARMVRPGESADVDVSLAAQNPSPKYPQVWYDKYKKTNPYKNDEKWYPYEQ